MHWVFQYDGFGACNVLVPREKVMRSIFAYNLDLWCNGSVFDSRSKGCMFDSRRVHFICIIVMCLVLIRILCPHSPNITVSLLCTT